MLCNRVHFWLNEAIRRIRLHDDSENIKTGLHVGTGHRDDGHKAEP